MPLAVWYTTDTYTISVSRQIWLSFSFQLFSNTCPSNAQTTCPPLPPTTSSHGQRLLPA